MEGAEQNPGYLHLKEFRGGQAVWLHMCIRHQETGDYLMGPARLDDLIVEAMLEEDTRSRIRVRDDGIMMLLKAMHVEGEEMAEPDDMISMRIWADSSRVITTREADVDPVLVMRSRVNDGGGPTTPGEFLSDIVEIHLDEVEPYIERLEDQVDNIAEMISVHQMERACPNMATMQSQISGFLRHLSPQRAVLSTLSQLDHRVLSDRDRSRFDDALNQLLRFLETLENLRERLEILNDQVARIQDRRLNRSSYAFAVAATIFLPLSFITGMFGVNLLGIPMSEYAQGFWLLIGFCALIVSVAVAFLGWRRWF